MVIRNEQLEFETHSHFNQIRGHLNGNAEQDAYWHFQAQEWHAQNVIQGALEMQLEIVALGEKMGMGIPYHHLVFGAGRRSKMIWSAIRQLHQTILPNRQKPLPNQDASDAARALNDVYIHTRGMLDNYAWTLLHLLGSEEAKKLHHTKISLFSKAFRSEECFQDFTPITTPFDKWQVELKKRRDPVAHRIPLTVPPAVLSAKDQKSFAAVSIRHRQAQVKYFGLISEIASQKEIDMAAAEMDELNRKLENIGSFIPMIIHDPTEEGVPIYPTVPEDVGMLVKLVRALNAEIEKRVSS